MDDEHFMHAVAQTVDALTFAQTHVVDCDFRAHSRTTADSVASLQNEQRSRVDQTFGAIGASPEYLAGVLLMMYRGEAAAVAAAKEQGHEVTMLDRMTDSAARAFKKEMKQRIHEWEGSFRERFQHEAGPNDKVVLRPIYELYKCAKARVLKLEAQQPNSPPDSTLGHRRPLSAPPTTTSASTAMTNAGAGAALLHATPSRPDHDARQSNPVARQSTGGGGGASMTAASPPLQSGFTPTAAVRNPASYLTSASTVTAAAHPSVVGDHAGPAGGAPQGLFAPPASLDELVNEKRRLKRTLHHFEADFESRYGRKPTKDDRKDYAKEYNRYGELKAILNESGKAAD
jgi:hypothetical protein